MKRIVHLIGALLLGLTFCLGTGTVLAQTGATTFTLQPGGTARITYEAYCTDFGLKFPTTLEAPNGVAEDNVRGALAYIQQNNLSADEAKALEAQYGIWQLRGATSSPAGGDTTKAVVAAASTAPATPQGTSVLDAISSGQARLTLGTWQPLGQKVPIGSATDNFYGRGELTIENTSQQALTLYMPVGTLFPPATAGEQTMTAYASNVQISNPQAAQNPQNLPNTAGETSSIWLPVLALLLIVMGAAARVGRRAR